MKKMKSDVLIVFINLVLVTSLFAGSVPPKREFRGAWVATVSNLDWPSRGASSVYQKQQLVDMLDNLKATGINAIIFQVRPACDAFYQSSYEPWSYWLTGRQGQAPEPFFDPLAFAVEQAHKRGMELHAWFNPYRAVVSSGYRLDAQHVVNQHPEWILSFGELKILDPGLPQVRDYVTNVIADVVARYDIDGVHFDDYFYPYPPNQITNEDDQTFANYSRGFSDRGAWRRDNVNLLVAAVYQAIQSLKPFIKFGISPFGIWKNGVPSGIWGMSAYNTIYADALSWIEQKTVDYLTPQLYWPFGGQQDFGRLMPWWQEQRDDRHLYVGHAAYRINSWPQSEMPDQIRLNRERGAEGSIFFRAATILGNPKGFTDSLKSNIYRYPAVFPNMAWKDQVAPESPQNLRYDAISNQNYGLVWDAPDFAADGDSAIRYVVYRFDKANVSAADLDSSKYIYDMVGTSYLTAVSQNSQNDFYSYAVTALDRNANESGMSNIITLTAPSTPQLASLSEVENDTPRVIVYWPDQMDGVYYQVQVALDSAFTGEFVYERTAVLDTFTVLQNLQGQQTYYCRTMAYSAGGESEFSQRIRIRTAFPATPDLVAPKGRNTALTPVFVWHAAAAAVDYQVQVSIDTDFAENGVILDQEGIADTTFALQQNLLAGRTKYYWRVRGRNEYGYGAWADRLIFKTDEASLVSLKKQPTSFSLSQNYPNPFNPVTAISFTVPRSGHVRLAVYNMLGQEVMVLLDQHMTAGEHRIHVDGCGLAAGIYIYNLRYEHRVLRKKMTFIK